MNTMLNPYLAFKDNARQAMEFYKSALGGKLDMQTFKDFHVSKDPREDNKIMHSVLELPNGIRWVGRDPRAS